MAKGVEVVERKDEELKPFGVDEGADVRLGEEEWIKVRPVIGSVIECHLGSTSIGLLEEEWFAISVEAVEHDGQLGVYVEGEFLGCEDATQGDFVAEKLKGGGIHLCGEDMCGAVEGEGANYVHVKRVRMWTVGNFKCPYLTAAGKKVLKDIKSAEKKRAVGLSRPKVKANPPTAKASKRKPAIVGAGPSRKKKGDQRGDEVITLESGDSEEKERDGARGKPAGISRAGLRDLFKGAKERMSKGGHAPRRVEESEDSSGGPRAKPSKRVREERRLISGTNFRPGKMTPLAIEDAEATKDGGRNRSMKKMRSGKDPADMLLAQAAQQGAVASGRKRKKDKKDDKRVVELLKKAVGGKKDKKKKKKKKRKRKRMKKDPDDPGGSGSSESSSSPSSSSSSHGAQSESNSDLSFEPPLRKKALTAPGSVLADLIKHAQEQLDKGSLMDHEGQPASLTSGIKLSTYFALLIRPNFPNNNPLLRELYQLAQSIDLLRLGRLAETGDALASRFVAVHTAMMDGNWQVASQLELYPLERVQSASTSTMLQAQRHRRLLWKAQGFSSRVYGLGRGGWQKGGDEEKGNQKGGKGKGKGKGRGKGQHGGGKDGWGNSGKQDGGNPWKENKEDVPKKA